MAADDLIEVRENPDYSVETTSYFFLTGTGYRLLCLRFIDRGQKLCEKEEKEEKEAE